MFVCVVIFSNADAVLTVSAQYCHKKPFIPALHSICTIKNDWKKKKESDAENHLWTLFA